jgi:hypothetical protein
VTVSFFKRAGNKNDVTVLILDLTSNENDVTDLILVWPLTRTKKPLLSVGTMPTYVKIRRISGRARYSNWDNKKSCFFPRTAANLCSSQLNGVRLARVVKNLTCGTTKNGWYENFRFRIFAKISRQIFFAFRKKPTKIFYLECGSGFRDASASFLRNVTKMLKNRFSSFPNIATKKNNRENIKSTTTYFMMIIEK